MLRLVGDEGAAAGDGLRLRCGGTTTFTTFFVVRSNTGANAITISTIVTDAAVVCGHTRLAT